MSMLVIDDTNWQSLVGPTYDERMSDGSIMQVRLEQGQKRYMSWKPTVNGRKAMSALPRYRDNFPVFPRSDWKAMLAEQKARRRRIIDYQNFDPHDQDGLPTCWANGPAHAGTTRRVMDGLPLVYLSACSAAVPISGGHSGGDEADAADYFQKYGAADVNAWSNNDTSRSLNSDPKVIESRKHHFFNQVYSLETFDEYASASLMFPAMPFAVAFNWWSHVISGGDLMELDGNAWALCFRNNWGDWGDKNELGKYGYVTMREGHGTPDSGFCIGPLTMSAA